MVKKIIICDDDPSRRAETAKTVVELGFSAIECRSGQELFDLLDKGESASLILLHLIMRDLDGLGVLTRLKQAPPVIMTLHDRSIDMTKTIMLAGAADVLVLPIDKNRLDIMVSQQMTIAALRRENDDPCSFEARSLRMKEVLRQADKASLSGLPVLITGEEGMGKLRLAKRVHQRSDRRDKPCKVIDCSVFSHFSDGRKRDNFKSLLIDGYGSLIFKNIDQLPPNLQHDLSIYLKTIDHKRKNALRFIATAHTDITQQVRIGQFSSDLYYFFSVTPLLMPNFVQRQDDLHYIFNDLIHEEAAHLRRPINGTPDLSQANDFHHARDIIRASFFDVTGINPVKINREIHSIGLNLIETGQFRSFNSIEREVYMLAYSHFNGNLSDIARSLGVGRSTVYRKFADYGMMQVEVAA